MGKIFLVRCRGIIAHDGKLLVVKHPEDTSYAALPGGHLEWGENIREGLRREIVEELGVKPIIGRLLYVHTFIKKELNHYVEFFFEITNSDEFLGCEKKDRTHSQEIAEILWIDTNTDINLKPKKLLEDFKADSMMSDTPKFIEI